jgi:hypothetical protein
METKSFFNALRKLIREEVQTAVRTEMKRVLNEQRVAPKQIIDHGIRMSEQAVRPSKPKSFVKDPMLNDLLNETAAAPAIQQEWPTMDFRSEMAQAFGGMTSTGPDMSFSSTSVAPSHDINGAPVNVSNEKVATVVSAMTKDYSALMKAIDKKKGIR